MVVPCLGFLGGIERHVYDLSCALRDRGHRLTLLHEGHVGRDPDQYAGPFDQVARVAPGQRFEDLDVAYFHKAARAESLQGVGGVGAVVAVHDHDLTCLRSYRYLPITGTACHRSPGVGCIVHGCCLAPHRDRFRALRLRVASPYRLRRHLRELSGRALLVACSRYIADGLVQAGAIPERVRVVHPVPPDDPTPPLPRPEAARLLGVGQLLRGKGFDLAIEALRGLPGATLELAGEGPSRPVLEALARRAAPTRVHFHGYVRPEALRALYDRATVVIVPSRWPEPFGMVGIEAMRRARPVAGAAHGGILEWLVDGAGGTRFEPGSVASLVTAVRALLRDREAGERARADVVARFRHTQAVVEIERILEDVARAPGRR